MPRFGTEEDILSIVNRFPPTLDADGGLKVHVQNLTTGLATEGTLGNIDANLTSLISGGSLKVAVQGTVQVEVTNPSLTDTELRASPVPVSGPLTDTQLRATSVNVAVTGPLNSDNEVKTNDEKSQALLDQLTTVSNAILAILGPATANTGRLRVHAEAVDNVSYMSYLGLYASQQVPYMPTNSAVWDWNQAAAAAQRAQLITD